MPEDGDVKALWLNSEVVEIASRVLISQVIHEPMLPVSDHASTVQPYSNPKVTMPWYPTSAEP